MNLSPTSPKLELMLWPELASHHNNTNPVSNGGVFYYLSTIRLMGWQMGRCCGVTSRGYLALFCLSWMLRRLTLGLLTSAVAVAPLPLNA